MKMSDLIQPGDRIDIQLVYQVERQQNYIKVKSAIGCRIPTWKF